MKLVLEAFATRQPPRSATQLLDRLTLHWAVAQGQLPAANLEPPTDLSPFVGRSRSAKAVTTPMEVDHILALVRALPDPRWRLAFQLMGACGAPMKRWPHAVRPSLAPCGCCPVMTGQPTGSWPNSSALAISHRCVLASAATTSGSTCNDAPSGTSCGRSRSPRAKSSCPTPFGTATPTGRT